MFLGPVFLVTGSENLRIQISSSSPKECANRHHNNRVDAGSSPMTGGPLPFNFLRRCDLPPDNHCVPSLKLSALHSLLTTTLSLSPMEDPPIALTGRAILKAVHASLGLVTHSSRLLTVSQLLVISRELQQVTSIVNGRLRGTLFGLFTKYTSEHFQLTPVLQMVYRWSSIYLTGK